MTQVEIFGFAGSTYVRTVLATAAEKGIACALKPVELGAESHRLVHPFAKMPAMRHGPLHLYETAPITVYLDEAFPGASLQPKAPAERALMWQWISSANAYFYPAFVLATLAEDGGGPDVAEAQERSLTVLDEALTGRSYLVGEAITLADLFVAPMLAFMVEQRGGSRTLLKNRDALRRWLDRVTERESFGRLAAA